MMKQRIEEAEELAMELLAVSGRSGCEGQMMELIVEKLRRCGASQRAIQFDQAHRRSAHAGESGNLAFKMPGTMRSGRRMLVAHVDTVPLCRGARPVRRGRWVVPADKHTALGADNRCGTAVLLATALQLLSHKVPHPPLTFLWTVQEEIGLHGARHARLGMLGKPRLAFNYDGGSAEKLTVGATGGYRMDIHVRGVASHAGSAPELGVNAITIASLAIAQLHQDGWLGKVEKRGRKGGYRLGTSNVGAVHGGEATNVVPPEVHLRAEARSHDPAFRRQIVGEMEKAFRKAARSVRNTERVTGEVQFEGQLDYESFKLADDEPCLLTAEAAIRHLGGEPVRAISNGGVDANWLTARGIPTVTLGCGQQGGHTVSERMNLDEFGMACRVALLLATATE